MSKPQQSKFLDLRDSPIDPKAAAAFGPRDLKQPGSFEWTVQTTSYAQRIWVSLDRDTKDWLKVVAEIDAQQVWTKYPPEKPYGTREAYFLAEFGKPEPELTTAKTEQQLGKANHAGPGRGKKTSSNTIRFGRDVAYVRARLERDGLTGELAAIERKETTPHAVAVKLGWRSRMIQHPATVEGFRRAIQKHLNKEERKQLKEQL